MDYGEYRERSIKYGASVRAFDRQASSQEMQECADAHRRRYQDPNCRDRPRRIAEAAWCQALADRKARMGR